MIYLSQRMPTSSGGSGGGTVGSLGTVEYDSRHTLRSLTASAGDMVVVEGLGLFQYESTTTALDDDETCFRQGAGGWVLVVPGWDRIYATIAPELFLAKEKLTVHRVTAPNASVGAGKTFSFVIEAYHSLEDVVVSTHTTDGLFRVGGRVIDDETVEISMTNLDTVTRSITNLVVQYLIIRGAPLT